MIMKNHFFATARYTILISILFFFSNVQSQVQTPRYVSTCNHSNGFYEYLPQGYSSSGTKKYPLLIFAHGSGEIGDGGVSQIQRVLYHGTPQQISQGVFPVSFTVNGQTFSFIVISPQFNTYPIESDMNQVINYAVSHYKVDTNRIYLTGLSMGGGLVWDYVGRNISYANRIAAIVPICGASTPTLTHCQNIAAANIAVWATHNSGDPNVPVSSTINYVNTIDGLPNPPNPLAKKTIFQSNTHDAWTATYNLSFKDNGLNVYQWMLQYSKANGTLAISGLEFDATPTSEGSVSLKWQTQAEANSRGFVIERSADGNTFDSIGFVSSLGVNGAGASYTFEDRSAINDDSYYRLKQVNMDNSYTLSAVRLVRLSVKEFLRVYPNPVHNMLNIDAGTTLQNVQLRIYNSNGSVVLQKTLNGNGIMQVPVSNLPAGAYSLQLFGDKPSAVIRFIKK